MPRLRKLNPVEAAALEKTAISAGAQVAREYDAYIADFVIGDYGRAELHEGERRDIVRRQLQAAARRRDYALRFRSGPGLLIFHVDPLPAPVVASPTPPVGAPLVGAHSVGAAQRDDSARRKPAPSRLPRRRPTAAERYHEVLPRWMREGQPPRRRGDSKRRIK